MARVEPTFDSHITRKSSNVHFSLQQCDPRSLSFHPLGGHAIRSNGPRGNSHQLWHEFVLVLI
jgi:hypothetical protein